VLLGLFMTVLARVSGNPIARFMWTYIFPIPRSGPYAVGFLSTLLGFEFPLVAFVLLMAGTGLALLESYIAPVEVGGLLANLMSYARLAGFAIGEGIIDATVTTLIFDNFVLHHDILTAVAGLALLFGAFLIFPLGALGAGIQALRLNYVEQFLKFFRGNGVPFRPFGVKKTTEA
jgi:vacuolar-type H+-ATPase subunit I/STV1